MSELELLTSPDEIQCRYCLGEDDVHDMVSPCKCSGSTKYVHRKCLREWFRKRSNSYVVPGRFTQYSSIHSCELCHTPYQFEQVSTDAGESLNWKIFQYMFVMTMLLFGSYAGVGALMSLSPKSKHLFITYENRVENLLANGFFMVHLAIGIFYVVVGTILALSSGPSFCFCYCPSDGGGGDCNDCGGDGCAVVIIILIIIGILATVLMIYFDVIGRVVERHKIKQVEVLDIQTYMPEPSAPIMDEP